MRTAMKMTTAKGTPRGSYVIYPETSEEHSLLELLSEVHQSRNTTEWLMRLIRADAFVDFFSITVRARDALPADCSTPTTCPEVWSVSMTGLTNREGPRPSPLPQVMSPAQSLQAVSKRWTPWNVSY